MLRLIATVALAALAAPASAQSVAVGVEIARDRFAYRFENPSSFDTAELVPHYFEQTYVADNLWLVASAHYTAGIPWETSGGATFERTLPATDYDTFVDPDGTVIVAGTSGDAVIRSIRISQRGDLGRAGPVGFAAGYSLRYDRANFLVGHKTVTVDGSVVQAYDVTDPETTSSLIQEFFFGVSAARRLGSGWRMMVAGDAAPATTGRLAIDLPAKYPGTTFVFVATSFTGSGHVVFTRVGRRRPLDLAMDVEHAWGYSSGSSLSRSRLSLRLSVDLRPR